jgi:hypothetical protein
VVVRRASVEGAARAAPMPWAARAPSSHSAEGASPPASDASVKRTMPEISMRRRPRMSPARAPSRSSPPKLRVYALCTQERLVAEKCSELWILGSAAMTTEMSRTIIR